MPPKEQLVVDERIVCRERRDQIKGQEGVKNAERKRYREIHLKRVKAQSIPDKVVAWHRDKN